MIATEYLRDELFTGAWFGLMTMVWFGWAQEAPPKRWALWLGVGSILGVLISVGLGIMVWRTWESPSALEGRYHWFGVLVVGEVVAAGLGARYLLRLHQGRWVAWWVAVVVALHFLPLAALLQAPMLSVLGVVQMIGLLVLLPVSRRQKGPTSALVGVWMGCTLLTSGLAIGVPAFSTVMA